MQCIGGLSVWLIAVAVPVSLATQTAFAHPGGLNGEGCHNDRKRGTYHCHRGTSRASRPAARSDSRMGPVRYPNCAAVRAAGKAPLRRGDPGYRPGLDRDNDGFACEYSAVNPR